VTDSSQELFFKGLSIGQSAGVVKQNKKRETQKFLFFSFSNVE
jgi:hypothetical protein